MAKAWYDVKKEISTLVARVLKVKKELFRKGESS